MSKTDDQIKSEIEDNESRAEWGAWAVVAGLVIEIVLALSVSLGMDKKWLENWGTVFADCLIVLGVYCEIHFGRKASAGNVELRRRSEQKVAEANSRAAEAQLADRRNRRRRRFGSGSGRRRHIDIGMMHRLLGRSFDRLAWPRRFGRIVRKWRKLSHRLGSPGVGTPLANKELLFRAGCRTGHPCYRRRPSWAARAWRNW